MTSYKIIDFVEKCGELLGVETDIQDLDNFQLYYEQGANFDGTETIREALTAVAEVTQTIYFMDSNNKLVFKRLNRDGAPQLTIDNNSYIELKEKDNRRLAAICSATELGDNIEASLAQSGTTQYIRNNPFLDLREDRAALVQKALDEIGGLTIAQFTAKWRGNFLLEIGDKIALVNKDKSISYSYFLTDKITYNGSYIQNTSWTYQESNESANNSASLGEVLKQTYAKVDKQNKEIEILASEASENANKISMLEVNTSGIAATVENIENSTSAAIGDVNNAITELTQRVETAVTAEDLSIEISKVVKGGVEQVTTSTGFTFNDEGMTVSKSGSEMKTLITDDGMKVYRDNTAVLTANNKGVDAVNLHATTYLIIGNNSRFEDYGNNRTGCFWIGG